LATYSPELAKQDPDSLMRMAAGDEVGALARELSPAGEFINTKVSKEALDLTDAMILKSPNLPLFEPAFITDDLLVRVDLLFPKNDHYKLVEVKSSTSVKPYQLQDLAIQAWVMRNSQSKPVISYLAHINSQFMYGGNNNYDGFLQEVNLTDEVKSLADLVPEWLSDAKSTVALKNEPEEIKTGDQCTKPFDCPFYEHCSSFEEKTEYPIEILPYGAKVVEQLKIAGYKDLREVPDGLLEKQNHLRVHRVTKSGIAELDPAAKLTLDGLAYPRFYLDFETISYAIPKIPHTRPFTQIPFQWSCHIQHDEAAIEHKEFLDTKNPDPRRTFTESLIDVLGGSGTIFVYSSFEQSRIREMGQLFPDLQPRLKEIEERLFDLYKLSKEHYYHPDMKGSWSIKKLLPTVTNLSYKDLAVQNGGMAQEAYKQVVSDEVVEKEKQKIRKNLLKYCEQDTWAMVEIVKRYKK
jgi:hypothetical protein